MLLKDDGDPTPFCRDIDLSVAAEEAVSIEANLSPVRLQQPGQQPDQRRFAAPRLPEDADPITCNRNVGSQRKVSKPLLHCNPKLHIIPSLPVSPPAPRGGKAP